MYKKGRKWIAWTICLSLILGKSITCNVQSWASTEKKDNILVASSNNALETLSNNALEKAASTNTLLFPEFEYVYKTNQGNIIVRADAEILPEGTSVDIREFTGSNKEQLKKKLQENLEDNAVIVDVQAYHFDLKRDGAIIQPQNGSVQLIFDAVGSSDSEGTSGNQTLQAFWMDDKSENITWIDHELGADGNIVIDAEHFSTYGLVKYTTNAEVVDGDYIGIYSLEDLLAIKTDRASLGKKYRLMTDIDLSGIEWEPIGKAGSARNSFHGEFDGNNHVISNMTISQSSDTLAYGLFGDISEDAVLKNIQLEDIYISGIEKGSYIGGICGRVDGWANKIQNCMASGTIEDNSVRGTGGIVGGITGYDVEISGCINHVDITNSGSTAGGIAYLKKARLVEIKNCTNFGDICAEEAAGIATSDGADISLVGCINLGQITGQMVAGIHSGDHGLDHGEVNISSCGNDGEIIIQDFNGRGDANAGGIASGATFGKKMNISECYNSKNLILNHHYGMMINIGGILGEESEETNISDSYNCGNIKCLDMGDVVWCGGILGGYRNIRTSTGEHVGKTNLTRCYNMGMFSESQSTYNDHYHAITKDGNDVVANNCYYLYPVTSSAYEVEGAEPLTESEMREKEKFKGFNFDYVWVMGSDSYPYPILQWQEEEPAAPIIPDTPVSPDEPLTITSASIWGDNDIYCDSDLVIQFNKEISCNSGEKNVQIREYLADTPCFEWDESYKDYVIEGNTLTIKNALKDCAVGLMYYLYIPDGFFKSATNEEDTLTNCDDKGKYSFVIGYQDENSHMIRFQYDRNGKTEVYFLKEVFDGECCPSPADPNWENHRFIGWFTEPEFLNEFYFDTEIHKNYTLYGKFVKIREGSGNSSDDSDSDYRNENNIYSSDIKDSGFVEHKNPSGPGNVWQCIKDGKPVTGYSGEKKDELLYYDGIPGSFFFDENGFMLTGWHLVNVDGKEEWKYFDETPGHRGYEIKAEQMGDILRKKSATMYIGSFAKAADFANDMNWVDSTSFLVHNFSEIDMKSKWLLITGNNDFMENDSQKRKYIYEIISNMCNSDDLSRMAFFNIEENNAYRPDKMGNVMGSKIAALAKKAGYADVASMYSEIKKATGYVYDINEFMVNYANQIQMMENLKSIEPAFAAEIDKLMDDYISVVAKNMEQNALNKLADHCIDSVVKAKIAGANTGAASMVVEPEVFYDYNKALGELGVTIFKEAMKDLLDNSPRLNAVENIIYSTEVRGEAVNELKKAEELLTDPKLNQTESQLKENYKKYIVAFNIAKEATIVQYENMAIYYDERKDFETRNQLYSAITELRTASFYQY